MTQRYFRVTYRETREEHRLVPATSPEEAREQIEQTRGRFADIEVMGVKEEFGWVSEGDGMVSRHS